MLRDVLICYTAASALRGPVARMLFAECDPFHTDMAKARFRSPFFLVLVSWSPMVTRVAIALRCCPRQVISKAHLEMMKNSAFYGNNGQFDNEIDLSPTSSLEDIFDSRLV